MTIQQILVLLTTFIVGLMAGAYIYITGYAPNYSFDNFKDEFGTSQSLAIRAEQIGGCQMAGVCPSFELDDDRQYSYISAHSLEDVTPEPIEGRLDKAEYTELQKLVEETNLLSLQDEGEVCNAAADGIDYRYDVVIGGISYELNSCGTVFYGSRLYNELLLLWGVMIKEEVVTTDEN